MERIKRNRTETIQRIMLALEEVLSEQGWRKSGINQVAEKAGVSKVLIYRYFGNVDGLFDYYVKQGKVFPALTTDGVATIHPVRQSDRSRVWHQKVIKTYRSFRAVRTNRELLKATVILDDPSADAMSRALDQELTHMVDQTGFMKSDESKAIAAILLGGMSFLTIMAHNNRPMIGIDLRSDEGWKRVENAMNVIHHALKG